MDAIDAVISWVDGYDVAYQKKLQQYCEQHGLKPRDVIEPTRIQQKNEIFYCLHSLKNYAPWLRTIYIITNAQTPPALESFKGTPFAKKIQIIDQNDLLKVHHQDARIFNSISVEWLIWLIPGLSEHFLYLNDDFFLLRETKPEDFFINDRLVVRGAWKVQTRKKWDFLIKEKIAGWFGKKIPVPNNPHRAWQEKSAQCVGWKKHFYLLEHAPFSLSRNTFAHVMAMNPGLLYENLSYPFRDARQTSSIPLIVHQDIKDSRVYFDHKHRAIMVNGFSHSFSKIKSRLHQAKHNPRITFLCMQSIDQAAPEVQAYMLDWLAKNIML